MAKEAHIIGAGIGGLAAAAILAKTGWKVVAHERANTLREVGAGIFLKENGLQVLEELGPLDDLIAKGTRLRQSNLKDANGRSLLARDISAERVYTVLRADLHQHLSRGADKSAEDDQRDRFAAREWAVQWTDEGRDGFAQR